MGDNIVKIMHQTLPYNAVSFISLYHGLDPEHSVLTGFQCISWHSTWLQKCLLTCLKTFKLIWTGALKQPTDLDS